MKNQNKRFISQKKIFLFFEDATLTKLDCITNPMSQDPKLTEEISMRESSNFGFLGWGRMEVI